MLYNAASFSISLIRKNLIYVCIVDVCEWGLPVFMYVAVCGGILFVF